MVVCSRLVGLLNHLQGLDFTLTLLTVHSLVEPLVLVLFNFVMRGRLFIGSPGSHSPSLAKLLISGTMLASVHFEIIIPSESSPALRASATYDIVFFPGMFSHGSHV